MFWVLLQLLLPLLIVDVVVVFLELLLLLTLLMDVMVLLSLEEFVLLLLLMRLLLFKLELDLISFSLCSLRKYYGHCCFSRDAFLHQVRVGKW